MSDDYYSRPEVSNSTLTALEREYMSLAQWGDIQEAYRRGTLHDCMITEPARIDFNTRTIGEYVYTVDEMVLMQNMKNKFLLHPFGRYLYDKCTAQKVVARKMRLTFDAHQFLLPMRMKADFFDEHVDLVADLKSTSCTSIQQFINSIRYFEYDRQAALYLDLAERNNFMFVGQSLKPPHEIFLYPIKRGDNNYKAGSARYRQLAFRYWCLF